MAALETAPAATLTLTAQERELLLSVLGQALRATQIEVHRTDALAYKADIQRREDALLALIGKLRGPTG